MTTDNRLPDYILAKHLKANKQEHKQLREAKKTKRRVSSKRTVTKLDD